MTTLSAAQLNGHTGDNEIGTPDDLFEWLNDRFQFDYDAAASHENHKAPLYSTVGGTFWCNPVGENESCEIDFWHGVRQEPQRDGLLFPWVSLRVFVNPPYGRGIYREFIEKAISERNNAPIIVMLAKYDASTATAELLRDNFHLEYLPRVKYKGMESPAPFASVIAIAKKDWRK